MDIEQQNARNFDELIVARTNAEITNNQLLAAWQIIANAGGGNWELESEEWQIKAIKWRAGVFGLGDSDWDRNAAIHSGTVNLKSI